MQSDTPRRRPNRRRSRSLPRPQPAIEGTGSSARGRGDGAWRAGTRGTVRFYAGIGEGERRARVRAALAYAVPFIPALVILVSERRKRWIRLHAARALIFFTLLMAIQVTLFAALVLTGEVVGTMPAAALVGLAFYAVYALAGVLGLVMWLRLVADAMSGGGRGFRRLSRWAERLERALARMQRLLPAEESSVRISGHAHHRT